MFADGIIEAVVSADERGAGEREEDRDVAKPTLSSLCDVSSRRAPAGTGAHRRGFLEPWYQSFAEYVPLTPCKHAHAHAAKLALGIWARGYNGTDRENSQYEVVSSPSITLRRPCEVARTNDGNSVLVLATFSEPQRL